MAGMEVSRENRASSNKGAIGRKKPERLGGDFIYQNDALQIYRGRDFVINEKIRIHQPTLGEICDLGEQKYFSFLYSFTATPTDMKYQLHGAGLDWNEISDYELFLMSYPGLRKEAAALLFGSLDFAKFQRKKRNDKDIVLYDAESDTLIDRSIYEIAALYLRSAHKIKKNVERAMTETTKTVLLEEAKEQFAKNQSKEFKSVLLPLISTMINMEGFHCGWADVWEMKINAFMDSVERLQHIKHADLLLYSGYSGFGVDLKKISRHALNYFSEPEKD